MEVKMKNYTITVNGQNIEVTVEERGGASAPVTTASAPVAPVVKAAPASSGSEGRVKVVAPMSGKILGVKVSVGQAVKKGEVVAVLEAMKMENDIVALEDGTIASINVNVGDSVETNQTLVTIN
ncbi:glutaconyl-CoA decarboxylase subunit gamma family protein [Lachnospiraceae bacterium oral taxon 082 str. F0431]|nr:glutaconyl-CoA decarboxylase subunit gamma family protein [Lachnospiraceae bacterium oral taxon 082 str. F0431]